MDVIAATATLGDLLARNDAVPHGTRVSMELGNYRSVA